MKCYHVFDELSNKKVLIPGCWEVVMSNDLSFCTCMNIVNAKADNKELKELREQVSILDKELKAHIRIIEKLSNRPI